MNRRQLVLGGALGVLAAGCAHRPPQYPLPQEVTVYIAVSDQVARTDTGNVSAMVDALEADLRGAGHFVNIVAARNDEAAPVPRIELQVRTSDPTDMEALAGAQLVSMVTPLAVVALGASGSMDVEAFIVASRSSPATYVGRVQTSSTFGTTLGQDETTLAGERAGHDIASKLLR
jgi:hypothetical protein